MLALFQCVTPMTTSWYSRKTLRQRSNWSGSRTRLRPAVAFLLTFDNHNSVNGIREFAKRQRGFCRVRAAGDAGAMA